MKICVIGGGASGLMASICAAEQGHDVTVIEHMERVGKKILSTGNGKCNMTNIDQDVNHYHGLHPEFAERIFKQCSYQDTLKFFTELGIYTKNRNGGLYPYSEQASAVLDVLRMKVDHLNVHILCNTEVLSIEKKDQFHVLAIQIHTKHPYDDWFDRVIITTGSKAAKVTGSDGSGYQLAASFGHHIIEPLPALVQLRSSQQFFKGIAGIRCDAGLKLLIDDNCIREERGELQITNYGISGIPVFQLSGQAARAIYNKEKVSVEIDFMPDMPSINAFRAFIAERVKRTPQKLLSELLIGVFHKNLCQLFLNQCNLKGTRPASSLCDEEIDVLAECIKQFVVSINGTNSFDQAQTCSGGIDTEELNDHLESKLVSGLFFAGEIIDIDGDCGGYNLQWAWSSGMLVGTRVAE